MKAKVETKWKPAVKPPLGVEPKWCRDERRAWDLIGALWRYHEAGVAHKQVWVDELTALLVAARKHVRETLKKGTK